MKTFIQPMLPMKLPAPSGPSRLFHRGDSRIPIATECTPALAYALWLAGPGTAIRVFGDNRPVQPWEFSVQ